ncbi:MutS family DNA mismatch repair protein [Anaeromicrobium sediminis]|uniref:DNA mismatch repair protein n=1 Tax=Anaeromicrobium sediminis TaxID=1478221 RepID=A0A267MMK5_9FIRM|nr:MutS family DNA mismatch repair protein [Anaeromicrobium sediminis]PAB60148.1 DNA mismatch repair protein [Anaeromicrobium sediminis]
MNSRKIYEKRVRYYDRLLDKLSKNITYISGLRLLVVVPIIMTISFASSMERHLISWGISLLWIMLFIYLVSRHRRFKKTHKYVSILKKINVDSIMRLDGRWTEFKDNGDDFQDENHNFSYDLDILGQGSLFQWINSGNTHMGKTRLAHILTHPYGDKVTILKRQEAISELATKRWWRHRLQAEGRMITEKNRNIEVLINWAKTRQSLYTNSWMIVVFRVLPIVTVSTFLLAFAGNRTIKGIPILFIIFQMMLLLINIKKRNKNFALVYKYKKSIIVYRRILRHFEKVSFQSEYLRELSNSLGNNKGISAMEQLKRLEALVDRIENRNNIFFFPINVISLWDYQCLIELERWKSEYGLILEEWLQKIGEIEALSSLGTIAYDYPNWTIPEITEESSMLQAKKIGHPLLTNRQVRNDANIQDPFRILLITGSNMSGKSTFLRTIGINLVLAYVGAPVCASDMICSIFSIHTCMRINDNLEKGISSFYGELLRIKKIVKASKENTQVFFLLDEIFKGTNSYDRHIGAKKLIKKLQHNGAIGLVSTHDLELGMLEKENTIKNYHFQEYYKDGQICFDYKLRAGISTTRNALHLMKIIGIEEGID